MPSSRNTTLAQSSPSPTPSLRVLTPSDAPVLHGRAQRDAGVSLHHGGPAAPVNQCLRNRRRVVFHGRRRLPGNRRVYSESWPRLRPRRRDRDRARVIRGPTGTSSDKSSSSTSDAKVATAAAVAVVVTIVLAVFIISFLSTGGGRGRAASSSLVDVSPVSTLAAPGIAAPSVVGKRPTPSPLRGSPPPRRCGRRVLLTPPREGGGGEFPSAHGCVHCRSWTCRRLRSWSSSRSTSFSARTLRVHQ